MSRDAQSGYYDEGGIEAFDVIRAKLTHEQFEGFLLGNALKYAMRLNYKGSKERDAEKLANYSAWFNEAQESAPEHLSYPTLEAVKYWGKQGRGD